MYLKICKNHSILVSCFHIPSCEDSKDRTSHVMSTQRGSIDSR
jgi:hypothetical protein